MSLRVYFKSAFLTFKENKLRSWLSSLGIIIGILSVVVLLAVGQWATQSILSNVESLWANLLSVTPWWEQQTNVRGAEWARSSSNVLTMTESDIIAKLPHVGAVSSEYSSRWQAIYLSQNMQVSVYGVIPSYLTVRNSSVQYGAFISQQNVDNVDKVAVIWSTTAETLFGTENPVGKDIRIGNVILRVIGVMKQKWTSSMGNADSTVFVPLTTAQQRLFGTKYLSDIALSVTTTKMIDTAKATIEKTLLTHFNITDADEANFTVASQADVLSTISSITSTMKMFLGAIAAISLIVWGIGVMNIMLVSVTERTREIGIRRAVGAQSKDIILQFLAESLVLCIFWGIVWIGLSYIIIFAIKNLVQWIITFSSILMAFGFATAIGIGFGIYPAYRAAKLKPIDALRYE